jgi:hypothetical protein
LAAQLTLREGGTEAAAHLEAEARTCLQRVHGLGRSKQRETGGSWSEDDGIGLILQGDATRALAKGDPSQSDVARKLYQEAVQNMDSSNKGAAVAASAALRIAKLCDEELTVRGFGAHGRKPVLAMPFTIRIFGTYISVPDPSPTPSECPVLPRAQQA